jgi:hypothetical protein
VPGLLSRPGGPSRAPDDEFCGQIIGGDVTADLGATGTYELEREPDGDLGRLSKR